MAVSKGLAIARQDSDAQPAMRGVAAIEIVEQRAADCPRPAGQEDMPAGKVVNGNAPVASLRHRP